VRFHLGKPAIASVDAGSKADAPRAASTLYPRKKSHVAKGSLVNAALGVISSARYRS